MIPSNHIDTRRRDIITKSIVVDHELSGGNYWLTKSSMNVGRNGEASFSLGGYMFTTAGLTNVRVVTHESYNDSANTWALKTDFNLLPSVGLIGFNLSLGYVGFGTTGSNVATMSAYNEISNAWSTKTSGITARRNHSASDLNGFGYVVQGFGASTVINVNERYDESANSWLTRTAALLSLDEQSVVTAGGFLISAFGRTNPGVTNTATSAKYDDASNSWTLISASSGTTRSGTSAFSSSDIVGYATGRIPSSIASNFSDNDRLDISLKTWTLRSPNPTALSLGVGGSINGNGYVMGGQTGSGVGIVNVTQYRNYHLYTISSPIKRTTDIPRLISISATLGEKPIDIPIQLRTDGVNWRLQNTKSISSIKANEDTTLAYGPTSNGVKTYEMRVGIPKLFSGVGGGFWVSRTGITAKYGNSGLSLGGFGFSIAGRDGSGTRTNTVSRYDDYIDLWASKSSISVVRRSPIPFELNDAGYICGGSTSDGVLSVTVDKYNNEIDVWTIAGSMSSARQAGAGYNIAGLGHAVGGSPSDGGGSIIGDSAINEQYNDSTNAWTTKTSAITSSRFPAGFSANHMGYVCTGNASTSIFLNSNDQYNSSSNVWVSKASTLITTSGTIYFFVDGVGYLSHGYSTSASLDLQGYSDVLNLWYIKSSANGTARGQGAGFSLIGSGYAAGGSNGSALSDVSRYITAGKSSMVQITINIASDPFTITPAGTWTVRASNPVARSRSSAFGINNKSLFAFGDDIGAAYNRADNYDDVLNSWTLTGSGASSRRFAAGFTTSGYGFVAGGTIFGSDTALTINDRYDSATGLWSLRASLPVGSKQSSGMSDDDYGYVTGGAVNSDTPVSTTVRYDNSLNSWLTRANLSSAVRRGAAFTINKLMYHTHGETISNLISDGYMYNSTIDSWASIAKGDTAKNMISSFAINSSGFISCGNTGSFTSATDEYLGGANVWVSRPNSNQARDLAAGSNVESNGFVVGGFNGDRVATNERYSII